MLLKREIKKLRKPRGVSIRFDKNDRATGIQLAFTYKGVQCREPVGFSINQTGLNSAANLLGTIKNEIAKETFFYANFFPKSKKLKLFGGATRGITVKTYLDRYVNKAEERGLSIATIVGYKKDLKGLEPLWSIPVAELERITIVNFVENATVSSKTLGNRLSVLRSALDAPCVRIVVASVFHKNITGSGKLDISEALS